MELLFVFLGGVCLGIAARYVLPGRATHGVLLVPAIGAAVASALWAGLTWAGWKFDGGWIWTVSLVGAALVSVLVSVLLPRRRRRSDESTLVTLSQA